MEKKIIQMSVCARLHEFSTGASCSKTVTARQARVNFFTAQLQNTSLFLLQVIRSMINKIPSYAKLVTTADMTIGSLVEWREIVMKLRSDTAAYNMFYNKVVDKFSNLPDIITLAIDAYVTLVGVDSAVAKEEEPIHMLYLYILRLMYIKPFIVMRDDDEVGTAVGCVSDSMTSFIPQSINLRFPRQSMLSNNQPPPTYTTVLESHQPKPNDKLPTLRVPV